jgi:hypothetical protein
MKKVRNATGKTVKNLRDHKLTIGLKEWLPYSALCHYMAKSSERLRYD